MPWGRCFGLSITAKRLISYRSLQPLLGHGSSSRRQPAALGRKEISKSWRVQERFVRQIPEVRGRNYEERLKDAGLTTLRERRKRGDVIETFKTLNGFNKVDKHSWFHVAEESARATRSTSSVSEEGGEVRKTNTLLKESVRLETRKNFFAVRVVDEWNRLPEKIRTQKSVNGFKNAYDAWKKLQRDSVAMTT